MHVDLGHRPADRAAGGTILTAALARAQEVMLGVAIGAILHWGFERLLFRRTG
ncbi:hypothetical protein GCM10020258_23500 [Sphingomonas yabuuchiae]